MDEALERLAGEVREINRGNGWNVFTEEAWADTYRVPAILALIHSEVSEALEAFRADNKHDFIVELADVVIRVLDLAGGFESFSFSSLLRAKLERNKERGFRHGGKRV